MSGIMTVFRQSKSVYLFVCEEASIFFAVDETSIK